MSHPAMNKANLKSYAPQARKDFMPTRATLLASVCAGKKARLQ
ncbi:MAG: hypothetical protein U1D28_11695 [Burkholderiales bacterium]|nr:hypothetical protein [Burkholderiales bacterium]